MKKKKYKIYQRLGSKLIYEGKRFLRKATLINKVIYPQSKISRTIKIITGVYPILNDGKYHTTDIETWKTIIKNDWTDKRKYVTDTFDCDNFADAFCSYCADIYELNSAGRFTVELLDMEGKHIGYHRAVIIIDNKLDCYLLESQDDRMVKIEAGIMPVIGNWKYKVNYISLN